MPLSSIGSVLQKKMGGTLGRQITDAVICDAFDQIVHEWWGERFDGHVKAKFVRDGALTVAVDHSLYAQEIKKRQSEILDILQEKVGSKYVHVIGFTLLE